MRVAVAPYNHAAMIGERPAHESAHKNLRDRLETPLGRETTQEPGSTPGIATTSRAS